MHINFNKLYTKKRFWAAILVVQFLLFYIFSKLEITVRFFAYFFKIQKNIHQFLFSWIPFSIGDIFYCTLLLFLIIYIIRCFNNKRRSESLYAILVSANIFYFTYQIFWGMLYFQEPLINKLPKSEITLDKRKILALKYLEKCKISRELITEDKNGIFTIKNWNIIEREILIQQKNIPKKIITSNSTEIHSFKPSLFGNVMSFSGIMGYYNPFSAEAQYNAYLPSTYLPFTLAHESAHQLGFAREQEANFIGYLIGVNSENIELRYSVEFFTLKSLLNSLILEDEDFVNQILKNYSLGMKRDRDFEKSFNLKHQGALDDIFGFTNNLFLKSNQQEGVVTYSYFVNLLVCYEK